MSLNSRSALPWAHASSLVEPEELQIRERHAVCFLGLADDPPELIVVLELKPPQPLETGARDGEEIVGEERGFRVGLPLEAPERDNCHEARACVDGVCGPCATDSDCATGERCVLEHCVRAEHIECRLDADCPRGASCVLSDYTAGTARSNEDMRAYCRSSSDAAPL